ncbi:unnamed protein product [Vitrella brassicaformis CCMP3155]|uniref:Cyclic nucleotide-binding domain-containing protein n=3 Tax=Vitrella brassicaformis TaxID=1169539 RepID=A0A0G4GSH4_VITBC|nr:unnamed protein product [Vitrella brassicaformis CCMP3155]|eukprot:CEM33426.1 unnamed protein product [Vitrella brassicaformis CCMP3155]
MEEDSSPLESRPSRISFSQGTFKAKASPPRVTVGLRLPIAARRSTSVRSGAGDAMPTDGTSSLRLSLSQWLEAIAREELEFIGSPPPTERGSPRARQQYVRWVRLQCFYRALCKILEFQLPFLPRPPTDVLKAASPLWYSALMDMREREGDTREGAELPMTTLPWLKQSSESILGRVGRRRPQSAPPERAPRQEISWQDFYTFLTSFDTEAFIAKASAEARRAIFERDRGRADRRSSSEEPGYPSGDSSPAGRPVRLVAGRQPRRQVMYDRGKTFQELLKELPGVIQAKVELLRGHFPGLSCQSDGSLEKLSVLFKSETKRKGNIIIEEGSSLSHVYIISSGTCRSRKLKVPPPPAESAAIREAAAATPSLTQAELGHVLDRLCPRTYQDVSVAERGHVVGLISALVGIPEPLTVVADSANVECYTIAANDAKTKLPKDSFRRLVAMAVQRAAIYAPEQLQVQLQRGERAILRTLVEAYSSLYGLPSFQHSPFLRNKMHQHPHALQLLEHLDTDPELLPVPLTSDLSLLELLCLHSGEFSPPEHTDQRHDVRKAALFMGLVLRPRPLKVGARVTKREVQAAKRVKEAMERSQKTSFKQLLRNPYLDADLCPPRTATPPAEMLEAAAEGDLVSPPFLPIMTKQKSRAFLVSKERHKELHRPVPPLMPEDDEMLQKPPDGFLDELPAERAFSHRYVVIRPLQKPPKGEQQLTSKTPAAASDKPFDKDTHTERRRPHSASSASLCTHTTLPPPSPPPMPGMSRPDSTAALFTDQPSRPGTTAATGSMFRSMSERPIRRGSETRPHTTIADIRDMVMARSSSGIGIGVMTEQEETEARLLWIRSLRGLHAHIPRSHRPGHAEAEGADADRPPTRIPLRRLSFTPETQHMPDREQLSSLTLKATSLQTAPKRQPTVPRERPPHPPRPESSSKGSDALPLSRPGSSLSVASARDRPPSSTSSTGSRGRRQRREVKGNARVYRGPVPPGKGGDQEGVGLLDAWEGGGGA